MRAIRLAKGLLREEIAREKMVCSLANEHILSVSVKYGRQVTARLREQHFKTHINGEYSAIKPTFIEALLK